MGDQVLEAVFPGQIDRIQCFGNTANGLETPCVLNYAWTLRLGIWSGRLQALRVCVSEVGFVVFRISFFF